ncbi:MAG: hypothetical protein JOY68_08930 [Candidatus Dormibacteraeota bacterium]|jgi:hypothetical protein|nr:hypothetical protein [Candidatus Dormibacteraeota bacterium]
MRDPRVGPEQLLRLGLLFELNGDRVSAVLAYRDVLSSGAGAAADEARRRLRVLASAVPPLAN